MVNWSSYNESLVRRGEVMLDLDVIDSWNSELKRMNILVRKVHSMIIQIHLYNCLVTCEFIFIYHIDKQKV
jgi:hypothetical protein